MKLTAAAPLLLASCAAVSAPVPLAVPASIAQDRPLQASNAPQGWLGLSGDARHRTVLLRVGKRQLDGDVGPVDSPPEVGLAFVDQATRGGVGFEVEGIYADDDLRDRETTSRELLVGLRLSSGAAGQRAAVSLGVSSLRTEFATLAETVADTSLGAYLRGSIEASVLPHLDAVLELRGRIGEDYDLSGGAVDSSYVAASVGLALVL